MVIGAFDKDLVFETSDKRVLTYTTRERTASSRWQEHEIIGERPRREKLGEATPTLSFSIHLSASCGVSPDDEAEKWLEAAESGRTGYLVIGGKVIGGRKYSVIKVTEIQNAANNKGQSLSADLNVTMEGYA